MLEHAMITRAPVADPALPDAVFEGLLRDFEAAEATLERYLAAPDPCPDGSVRRVLAQQMQQAVWRRYGELCEHLRSRQRSLPPL